MTAASPGDGGQPLIIHEGRVRIAADVAAGQQPKPVPPTFDDRRRAALDVAATFIELDRVLTDVREQYAEEQRRHADTRRYLAAAGEERKMLLARLAAVRNLHWESEQVICGDGCCHEGLGVCRHCGEAWPCTTYRAADGKPPPGEPTSPHGR